jgi:hypothetical protein
MGATYNSTEAEPPTKSSPATISFILGNPNTKSFFASPVFFLSVVRFLLSWLLISPTTTTTTLFDVWVVALWSRAASGVRSSRVMALEFS